jgi:hypothetical protein
MNIKIIIMSLILCLCVSGCSCSSNKKNEVNDKIGSSDIVLSVNTESPGFFLSVVAYEDLAVQFGEQYDDGATLVLLSRYMKKGEAQKFFIKTSGKKVFVESIKGSEIERKVYLFK